MSSSLFPPGLRVLGLWCVCVVTSVVPSVVVIFFKVWGHICVAGGYSKLCALGSLLAIHRGPCEAELGLFPNKPLTTTTDCAYTQPFWPCPQPGRPPLRASALPRVSSGQAPGFKPEGRQLCWAAQAVGGAGTRGLEGSRTKNAGPQSCIQHPAQRPDHTPEVYTKCPYAASPGENNLCRGQIIHPSLHRSPKQTPTCSQQALLRLAFQLRSSISESSLRVPLISLILSPLYPCSKVGIRPHQTLVATNSTA